MSLLRCCFLVIMLFRSFCWCEEQEEGRCLVDQLSNPVPKIAGAVNLITGDYVDTEVVATVSGVDPYVLSTYYSSSDRGNGSLAYGFSFSHDGAFVRKSLLYGAGSSGRKRDPFNQLFCQNFFKKTIASEVRGIFHGGCNSDIAFSDGDLNSSLVATFLDTGYTRTPTIAHPYGHNLVEASATSHKNGWMVDLGDRCVKKFGMCDTVGSSDFEYLLQEEKLPSGNFRLYSYDHKRRLKEIKTVDSSKKDTISWIQYSYHKDHIDVKTSEGLTSVLGLKKMEYVSSVVSSILQNGQNSTRYSFRERGGTPRLYRKTFISGLKHKISYYHKGKNSVAGGTERVEGSEKKEFFENRVKELFVKTRQNGPYESLYTVSYKRAKKGEFRAIATAADGYSMSVTYNTDKRPIWSTVWAPKMVRIRSEFFRWSEKGNLEQRMVFGEDGKPLIDVRYSYDKHGNIRKEIYRGFFTGKKPNDIENPQNGLFDKNTVVKEAIYNERGLQTGFSDELGNWTYVDYEKGKDCIVAKRICSGKKDIIRREFFSYNDAGVCVETIKDDGSSEKKESLANVTFRKITKITPRTKVPYYGTPDCITTSTWTKKFGKKIYAIERNERDEHGRIIASCQCDEKGQVIRKTVFFYDSQNRVTHTIYPDGSEEWFMYDAANRIAARRTDEAIFAYTYDRLGRILEEKKTYHEGGESRTTYAYDLYGRNIIQVDEKGHKTETTLDSLGRLVQKIGPSFLSVDGCSQQIIRKKYCGYEEETEYVGKGTTKIHNTALGKPCISVDIHGNKTFFTYDKKGNLRRKTEPTGLVTDYVYDSLGRLISVHEYSDTEDFGTIFKKYRGDFLVEEKYPTKTVRYSYDGLGRLSQQKILDLVTHKKISETYEYDALHRRIATIHSDTGVKETVAYDAKDRIIAKRTFDDKGCCVQDSMILYDTVGRVIESGEGRNGQLQVTKTKYGKYGEVKKVTLPDGAVYHYEYDPMYEIDGVFVIQKTMIDPKGVVTKEYTDCNGMIIEKTIFDPFGKKISHKKSLPNRFGMVAHVEEECIFNEHVEQVIKTTFAYDSYGQMTSCTFAADSPESATYWYRYDRFGRKISTIKPSGVELLSTYDCKGRLVQYESSDTSIRTTYQYNIQNLPTVITNMVTQASTKRAYDGVGHLLEEELENGLKMSYMVGPSGRLYQLTYPDETKTFFSYESGLLKKIHRNGWEYLVEERDVSGRIIKASLPKNGGVVEQREDCMGRMVERSHPAFSEKRTAFDFLGNCTEREIGGEKESFAFDFLSQVVSENDKKAAYDSLNRRKEYNGNSFSHSLRHQVVSSKDGSYEYDCDGRRVSDGRFYYMYDAADRLICCDSAEHCVEYMYDSSNRLIASKRYAKEEGKQVLLKSERYLYQGMSEIGTVCEDGRIEALRILGEGNGAEIGAAVAFEIKNILYIPIHDLSGNVRVLLDEQGTIVDQIAYSLFGPETIVQSISPWTFASKRQDPETGFVFFGQRFYDPQTATWITQDPLGLSAGPNLYAYLRNNPLHCTDPYGFFGFSDACNVVISTAQCIVESVLSTIDTVIGFFGGEPLFSDVCASLSGSLESHSFQFSDGTVITDADSKKDGLYVYPDKTVNQFIENHKGEEINGRILITINGIMTSLPEAFSRAERLHKQSSVIEAIVIAYNATRGACSDCFETSGSLLSLNPNVEKHIYTELVSFFGDCRQNNIQFKATAIAHSQGGIIWDRVYNKMERECPDLASFVDKTINLGAASFSTTGDNYVAFGDPIILTSLSRPFSIVSAFAEHRIHFCFPSTIEFPHYFDGSAYQKVIDSFLKAS